MDKLIPYAVLILMVLMLGVSWKNVAGYKGEISKEYNRHIQSAEELVKKEIYIDAVNEYEAALSMKPENYEVAMKIVDLYNKLNKEDEYVQACKKAISADPKKEEPYIKLADYYIASDKYKNAITILNEAQKEIGENDEIIKRMIMVKGQYTIAVVYDNIAKPLYYINDENGYAVIEENGLQGLIDENNNVILECKYDDVSLLSEGLIPVKSNNEYYCIDSEGYRKLVLDFSADYIGTFNYGYAPVSVSGKYGFIDAKGKKYKVEYSYTGCFSNGIAPVKKDNKWAIVNTELKEITGFEFDEILINEYGFCSDYGVFFAKQNEEYYLYNNKGEKISEGFEDVKMFKSDEPTAVKKNGKWGYLSKDGKIVIEPEYDDAKSFNIGYAPVLINGKWGCIDEKKNVLITPAFDSMEAFSKNGYASVKIEGVEKFAVVNIYE